jgi:DNA-binding transcriptional MocR family regulator
MRALAGDGVIERVRGSGSIVVGRSRRPARSPDRRHSRLAQVYDHLGQGVIEMVAAAPIGDGAVPRSVWDAALSRMDRLEVGTGYFLAQGLPELRSAIAAHMAAWGITAEAEDIVICNGAQQGLSLTVDTLVSPGDHVIVEEYTWAGALDALRAAGARLISIPSDGAGLDVIRLREALAGARPTLVYLCPTVNNPTGETMSVTRRMRVMEACRAHGVTVVDDCANTDVVIGERPAALATYEPQAQVITIGSVSKLFWGGLRIGWIHAPTELLARLAERRRIADLGSPLITQVVATLLMAEHAEVMRTRRVAEIEERLEGVSGLLARELPGFDWTPPSGGYMLWLRLPHGESREFAHYALREGVAVLPGNIVSSRGTGSDRVRLALIHDRDTMTEAFRRLGLAWRAYAPAAATQGALNGAVVV